MARRQVSIFINGKEVANQIKSITAEKRKLTRELANMTRGSEEYNRTVAEIRRLNGIIGEHQNNLRGVESTWDKLKGKAGALAGAAGIGGIAIAADMAVDAIKEIVTETKALRREITQLTGASGDELDNLTVRIGAISKTFGAEQTQVLQSANTLVKEFGISYDEAFNQIQKGFLMGADASGDFLDNVKEYSTQFREAGFSAEEFAAIAIRAQREGIFSDKGLDVVKEFGLNIREQTTATATAMENAFGKKFTDEIFGGINDGSITAADALQRVATEMNNAEIPAKDLQTVIADVFVGAGEDAGLRYIQSLQDIQDETLNTIADTDGYIAAQAELLKANTDLSEAENRLTKQLEDTGDAMTVFFTNLKTVGLSVLSDTLEFFEKFPATFAGIKAAAKQAFDNLLGSSGEAKSIGQAYREAYVEGLKAVEVKKETAKAFRIEQEGEEQAKEQAKVQAETNRRRAERQAKANEQEAKQLEAQQKRLADVVAKFQEERILNQLNEEDKKLEKIRQQYQKQIDVAKELEAKGVKEATEQRIELERLRDVALEEELQKQFMDRQAKADERATAELLAELERDKQARAKKAEDKALIDEEINQATLEDQALEKLAIEAHYKELEDLAIKHGYRVQEIVDAKNKALAEQEDKEQQSKEEKQREELNRDLAIQQEKINIYKQASDSLSAIAGDNQAILSGIFLFEKALAAAQVIINLQKEVAAINASYATLGPVGTPLALAATTRARIRAGISLATIGATAIQKFAQKKEGGFTDVIGATDGRKYSARYIGDPPTGMLNYNSPILTASGVLGNERGPEYFVSAADVQRPAVLDHIRAIENITRARQFQDGGATAPLPAGQAATAFPPEMMAMLQNINATLLLIQQTPRQPLIGDDEIVRLDKRGGKLRAVSGGTV